MAGRRRDLDDADHGVLGVAFLARLGRDALGVYHAASGHFVRRDEVGDALAQRPREACVVEDVAQGGHACVRCVEAGLADLVETDHRITDDVRLVPTHGHSPGHVSVLIESGGEQALITGDATHHPVQWAEPDWGMPADSDTPMAAETRRRLRAEHGPAGTLILGTHYAAPSAGRIVQVGDDWRFQAEPT